MSQTLNKSNKLISKTIVNKTICKFLSKRDQLFKERFGYSYKDIKQFIDSPNSKPEELKIFLFNQYYFIMKDGFELVFINERKVTFKNGYIGNVKQLIIGDKVISTIEINYIINKYKLENLLIFDEKENWIKYEGPNTLVSLLPTLKDKDLIFKSNKHIPEFKYNNYCITKSTTLEKKSLSQYFSDYFKYNDDDKNKNFEFFETKQREKFKVNILIFVNSTINFFKITGPSNNGKSITLLYCSRLLQNIVYLNLKTLKKFNGNNKMLKIFFYELQRIKLEKSEIDEVSKILFENNDFWTILYLLIDKFKDKKIVFILDQFSSSTVNMQIYLSITELVKLKSIKLILCSSINDKIIKDQVILTLTKLKGNKPTFTHLTEQYYYYFADLIDIEKMSKKCDDNDKEVFKLFNFCDEYIKLIKQEKTENKLNSIAEIMYNKIDKSFQKGFIDYKYILVNLQNFIKRDIEYGEARLYLKQTPLKYFKLVFYDKFFQIDYQFPFVKVITDKCLSEEEVDKYFKDKQYLVPDKEENKGIYFERAVKYKIKKCNFLPNKINSIIKVDSIISFNNVEKKDNTFSLKEPFNLEKKEILKEKTEEEKEERIPKKKRKRSQPKGKKELDNNNVLQKKRYRSEKIEDNIKANNESKQTNNIEEEEKEEIQTKNKIENKSEKKIDIKEDENIPSNGIFIEQNNPNGELLDLAFLYGDKNEVTFLGFQIKFYGKNTDLKDKDKEKYTKENIKKSYLLMNSNIKKIYNNVNINKYHFIFVLYFNEEDEEKYNKNLVKFCNANDIKYIFYNPVKQIFYNEQEQKIDNLILDDRSDVDSYSKINYQIIFKNPKSILNVIKYIKDEKNPELILKELLRKDESKADIAYTNLLQNLKNQYAEIKSIDVLGIFEIKFYKLMVCPEDSYGLLFYGGNNFLYYIFNYKEEISFYKISKSRSKIEKVNMINVIRDKITETVFIIKANY